jgi:tetratricopeptide (TPR) repeat protein
MRVRRFNGGLILALLFAVSTGRLWANNEEAESHAKVSPAPRHEIGTNLILPKVEKRDLSTEELQRRLELARKHRIEKDYGAADRLLMEILKETAAVEFQRPALLELAYVTQEAREFTKAQHLYSEYVRKYPQDPTIPEVVLRQGRLYRDMGAPDLAVSKFYSVMSTALNLKLGEMDYYQSLVLQAQTEIAETRYQQGNYAEAEDFLERLLKLENPQLNRALILSKLIRSLSAQQKRPETISQARNYIEKFPNSSDVAEIRFLLADALKKSGQNREAMTEVLILLESEEKLAPVSPNSWEQWRQRAGNDIANQLYQEGDFVNALAVYTSLAQLNGSQEWQLSVWYQMGLIYERLKQPARAIELYDKISTQAAEKPSATPPRSLTSVLEMANWRRDHLRWLTNAEVVSLQLRLPPIEGSNPPNK